MARRLYLVSYDIRSPKRWRRVFRLMERSGTHRQLSVFFLRATRTEIARLARELEEMIETEQDSVLIAPVDKVGLRELGVRSDMPGARVVIM